MSIYDEPEDMPPGPARLKAATVKQARSDMRVIDEFAARAMQSLITLDYTHDVIPHCAYDIAFAMFRERCKRQAEFLERNDVE